jgi:phosphoribosylamine--glycine ligase
MRFLGVTETCDLAALYLRLAAAGHDVRISVSEPKAKGTLAGMVPRTGDWRAELEWIREAGENGIILFEAVSEGLGLLQDSLRTDGFRVIGGSAFGDRLENDRAFAQRLLSELGLPIASTHEFSDASKAIAFITSNPGRYVLKFSGADHASSDNYVGQLANGRDVVAMLHARLAAGGGEPSHFILMDHVEGIEMGVGAYFNGEAFLQPACLDWEHKRFFAGDMGELTGEMGTVVTYDRSLRFFERTLAPVAPLLREARHVGYVNVNTIVNEQGIWPLEFTCRFGYPGYAILDPLQTTSWAELFRLMASGTNGWFETRPGFSLGIVMTTPPFPYSRKDIDQPVGLPILLPDDFGPEDLRHVHYGEAGMQDGQLVTSGLYGWTLVVTGTGTTVNEARDEAYRRIARIVVPNARYRLDIGEKLLTDWARLEALDLLDSL